MYVGASCCGGGGKVSCALIGQQTGDRHSHTSAMIDSNVIPRWATTTKPSRAVLFCRQVRFLHLLCLIHSLQCRLGRHSRYYIHTMYNRHRPRDASCVGRGAMPRLRPLWLPCTVNCERRIRFMSLPTYQGSPRPTPMKLSSAAAEPLYHSPARVLLLVTSLPLPQ